MKRVILHAGPHKTGTTYIQRHLDHNAGMLRGQGILVPTEWRDSAENPSHTGLTTLLMQGAHDTARATIAGWAATGCDTAIIATEVLVDIGAANLQALKDMFPGAAFTVVLTVRRWSELLRAAWHEEIVHGSAMPLLEYIIPTLNHPQSSRFVNVALHVEQFIAVFGRANVRLVSYNAIMETKRDIFAHFMFRTLGIRLKPASDTAPINPSWPAPILELVRILNHVDRSLGQAPSGRMAVRLNARSDVDTTRIVTYLERFRNSISLSDDEGDIGSLIEDNWTAYNDLAVPPLTTGRFYDKSVAVLPFIASEYALVPGFAETVRALHAELVR